MNNRRLAAAAGTLLIAGTAVASAAPVGAASSGKGTTIAKTTIADVELGNAGSVLSLQLLTDSGTANTDSAQEADAAITALAAKIPALNVNQTIGVLQAKTPGAQPTVNSASVDLSTLPVAGVASGTLNLANLTSAVDASGARSGMNASLSNVSLAGGLASVNTVGSQLGTGAAATNATGTRSVNVASVDVLNLGDVLRGVGIDPSKLTVAQLSALLAAAGVSVPGVDAGQTLATTVASLNGAITNIQSVLNPTAQTVTGAVDSTTSTLLTTLSLPAIVPSASGAYTTATANLAQLQSLLTGVATKGLAALDGVSLVHVDGLSVTVGTKATDSVATSAAGVTVNVGDIKVAGLTVPIASLSSSAMNAVTAAQATINSQLSTVLGTLSPQLANLVSVNLLAPSSSVTQSGGYTKALASVTALTASITPPSNLAAIVTGLVAPAGSVASLIPGGTTVPVVGAPEAALARTLQVPAGVLSGGAVVNVGQVQVGSQFADVTAAATPVASSNPQGSLPRTGAPAFLGIFGALAAAGALAGRRLLRRPAAA